LIHQYQWSWFQLLASQRSVKSLNWTLKGILATLGAQKTFYLYTPKHLVADTLHPDDLSLTFKHGSQSASLTVEEWLTLVNLDQPVVSIDGWVCFLTHHLLRPLSVCIIEQPEALEHEFLHALLELHSQMHLLLARYTIDPLTGLFNREHFDRWVRRIYERNLFATMRALKDSQWCLSLLDLDNFTKINQKYGTLVGDQVLAEIGNLIRSIFRPDDGLFRYSGDRFAILLRESNIDIALNVMERFRERIADHSFPINEAVTASIGMTQLDDRLWISVIGDAKNALEQSKAEGGNKLNLFEALLSSGTATESQDWYGLEWLD
jgi:diguanylate cyclase (GGDEF)-like protein